MKASFHLGERCSGVILSTFLALCISVIFTGCQKEPNDPPPPPPVDTTSTLKVSLNGIAVSSTYSIEIITGNSVTLKWDYHGKVPFEVIKNSTSLFSDKIKGDTTFVVMEQITLTFLVQGVPQNQKIGITLKNEIILPTASLSADPLTIFRGDSVTLTWNTSNSDSTYMTTVPNFRSELLEPNGTMKVAPQVTTTYTINTWNMYGIFSASVTVAVNMPPPPTFYDYIQSHPWKQVKQYYKYFENDQWEDFPLSSYTLSKWTYFYENNWHEMFKPGPILVNNGPYSINDSTFVWGMTYKIIKIDYDSLITTDKEPYSGSPSGFVFYKYAYASYP